MDFDTLKALAREGPLTLVVDGQCMGEALPHGSEVRIESKHFYWPGDIVVYGRGDGKLVSHRFLGYILSHSGWLALTSADTASQADGPVRTQRLLGVLREIDKEPIRTRVGTRISAALRYLSTATKLIARRIFSPPTTGTQ